MGHINDIDLKNWRSYEDVITDSLWVIPQRDSSGVHDSWYHGAYIPQIPNQFIRRYTKRGGWVLDPFAGSGTTLIEAQRLGRNAVGVELRADVVVKAREAIEAEPNQHNVVSRTELGDALDTDYAGLLSPYGVEKVNLVMLHPPYADIIKFSDDPRCLSNCGNTSIFLEKLGILVSRIDTVLAYGGHAVLVISDKFTKGEWQPLGFWAMGTVMTAAGWRLKSIVVKNFGETKGKGKNRNLWRYRALKDGYYVFAHEYVLLFEKLSTLWS